MRASMSVVSAVALAAVGLSSAPAVGNEGDADLVEAESGALPANDAQAPTADQSWLTDTQTRIADGEYAVRADAAVMHANNRAHGLRTTFDDEGARVLARAPGSEVALELRLVSWGRANNPQPASSGEAWLGSCIDQQLVDEYGDCLRKVEYLRPGITEWWSNTRQGLEHGFSVEEIGGEGLLAFDIEVSGSQLQLEDAGDAFGLTSYDGHQLRYAGLAVFGADGSELPASFESWAGGIRIIVDPTGAVWPIVVDPVLTSVHWSDDIDQADAAFGYSVASAGDVNADGFGDVIVGAFQYDNGAILDAGRAYLYLGSFSGLSGTPTAASMIGTGTGGLFGKSVASAGDVDGDGFGDLVIGAPEVSDATHTDEGRVYVYFGQALTPFIRAGPWVAEVNQTNAYFGHSVASAGDFNCDGRVDVIAGAFGFNNVEADEGRAYVFFGKASSPYLETTPWTAEINEVGARFGISVAGAGDVDGDGCGDVIVGADLWNNATIETGGAFLYRGSTGTPSSSPVATRQINQLNAHFGHVVASAGDVNGDGRSDVIIGAYDYNGTITDEGGAFIFLGQAASPYLAAGAIWTGTGGQADSHYGASVASAGDVNGDGYSDVIVGSSLYNSSDEGRAQIYLGNSVGAVTPHWSMLGGQTNAYFGRAVSSAGDVNGDGFSDVLVGAYGFNNPEANEGRAFVYLGSGSSLAMSPQWFPESNVSGAYLGQSVASAGDVNGDGYGDAIVGAPGHSGSGRAFVYHGTAAGYVATPSWTGQSAQGGSQFGTTVASAGDVNGDGYGDVVIGAPTYGNGGAAFVYFGSSSGLEATPAWTVEGEQLFEQFGTAVAAAGDVNGDGFADVLVGSMYHTQTYSDEGAAFLYLGSDTGPETTPVWTATGGQASACFGCALASAGDVNGDGFDDVIVGASGYGAYGQARVFFGTHLGVSAASWWEGVGATAGAEFGYRVASAGDVNRDGYADVAVGAPGSGTGQAGRVYVFMGEPAGTKATYDWVVEGPWMSHLGTAVSSAGDVNGDGYSDLVIGAEQAGTSIQGRAYLYHGSAGGLSTSAMWTYESATSNAYFGSSAAGIGDANGDGFSDVIIGAPSYNNGHAGEGRVFMFLGNGLDGTGSALAKRGHARRPGLTIPIAPLGASSSETSFDVAMFGRPIRGRGKMKLQVEVKLAGTAFDGTNLQTIGTWTDSGVAGAWIQAGITGLQPGKDYEWRARLVTSPTQVGPAVVSIWTLGRLAGPARSTHIRTKCPSLTKFLDLDKDTYGDPDHSTRRCWVADYVPNSADCNDANAAIKPGATEVTGDGVDQNCDDEENCYLDFDYDTFRRDPPAIIVSTFAPFCTGPQEVFSSAGIDCNDTAAFVNPDEVESCNNINDNCVSGTDEGCDDDGDDYCDASMTTVGSPAVCPNTNGSANRDCNDANIAVHPGAIESCNDTDDNCSTVTDEGCDDDGDDYCDSGMTTVGSPAVCPFTSGGTNTDCDDANDDTHPDADELCDGLDNDCINGIPTNEIDTDSDNYVACQSWVGAAGKQSDDCAPNDSASHPGALEVCDGNDNDCSGSVPADETDPDVDQYVECVEWVDLQNDNPGILGGSDCAPTDAAASPARTEVCDGKDNDCDGDGDEDVLAGACFGSFRNPVFVGGLPFERRVTVGNQEIFCVEFEVSDGDNPVEVATGGDSLQECGCIDPTHSLYRACENDPSRPLASDDDSGAGSCSYSRSLLSPGNYVVCVGGKGGRVACRDPASEPEPDPGHGLADRREYLVKASHNYESASRLPTNYNCANAQHFLIGNVVETTCGTTYRMGVFQYNAPPDYFEQWGNARSYEPDEEVLRLEYLSDMDNFGIASEQPDMPISPWGGLTAGSGLAYYEWTPGFDDSGYRYEFSLEPDLVEEGFTADHWKWPTWTVGFYDGCYLNSKWGEAWFEADPAEAPYALTTIVLDHNKYQSGAFRFYFDPPPLLPGNQWYLRIASNTHRRFFLRARRVWTGWPVEETLSVGWSAPWTGGAPCE
jgi:hypothetical protein